MCAVANPVDGMAAGQYQQLLSDFRSKGAPQTVNFRDLVSLPAYPERFTHLIHPYPAKLLAHIPTFFLANAKFSKPGDTVLDPFCGSGTVLLEALVSNHCAVGIDINPLAVLVSRVKTTYIDPDVLRSELARILVEVGHIEEPPPVPDVVNLEYWFLPEIVSGLACLKAQIVLISDVSIREFFLVVFSCLIRKVSLADPTVSVPVRLNPFRLTEGTKKRANADRFLSSQQEAHIPTLFAKIAEANISRISKITKSNGSITAVLADSRLHELPEESVDLIITSPPYAGAQKYIRASSLNIGWLDLAGSTELKNLDRQSVGREHFRKNDLDALPRLATAYARSYVDSLKGLNAVRAKLVAEYIIDLESVLTKSIRSLKFGKYAIIVIGNTTTCGQTMFADQVVTSIMNKLGMELELHLLDGIKSRGLMTRRNRTAGLIAQEHVLIYKKAIRR